MRNLVRLFKNKVMDKNQSKQLHLQVKTHQHKRYTTNIILDTGISLNRFEVHAGVLRPEIMTSLYLAKWLFFNNGIYKGKTVLDMGCGTGLMGIVMGIYKKKKVTYSDIEPLAIINTESNVKKFNLTSQSSVMTSDLFQNIKGRFDVIVFNHPFFGDTYKKYSDYEEITNGILLKKFLIDAMNHLKSKGKIIMPYYHLAGLKNNPMLQAKKLGYSVETRLDIEAVTGIQKGPISIYEIS